MADFPKETLSRVLDQCREHGQPFILSMGGYLHVVALPPDHRITVFRPPIELTPDVLRVLLAGRQ